MAIFSNQATLNFNGVATNSNIIYGEVLETLSATKIALEGNYTPGGAVTYAVTLRNTGSSAVTDVTVTDDLGAYPLGTNTVYPLDLAATDVRVFVNGTVQNDVTVTQGPPLTVTGIDIPAGGDAIVVYQATVTEFAPPAAGGAITNTATVTGGGLTVPLTVSQTVNAATAPNLTITKAISPAQVVDNERVTYTITVRNFGNEAVELADGATVTDTFNPILTDLEVTLNGVTLAERTQYTYNEATGEFATVAGVLEVPAATYTQDPATGAYTVTPGTATLVVTGTI